MIVTTTIIAVALGMTPVDESRPSDIVTGNYDHLVGRYSERVDSTGTNHIRGFDPRNGNPYDVFIKASGQVEARIGGTIYNFRVRALD